MLVSRGTCDCGVPAGHMGECMSLLSNHQAGLAREQGTMKQGRGSGTGAGVYQEGRGAMLVLGGSINVCVLSLASFCLYQLKRSKRTWLVCVLP